MSDSPPATELTLIPPQPQKAEKLTTAAEGGGDEKIGPKIPTPITDKNNNVDLWITYDNIGLSYNLPVQPADATPPNPILNTLSNIGNSFKYHILRDKRSRAPFYRLKNASGFIKPGQTTLVLGSAGCGRTTLLKCLTQQLLPSEGQVFYNGYTYEEARSGGAQVDVKKMMRHVDQQDCHFDNLTVRETLEFVYNLSTPVGCTDPAFLDHLLDVFEMKECSLTLVGRCSGGQRRRLSTLIAMCNPHLKLLSADQLNDGLDSYSAERIATYLKEWCKLSNAHFICTFQQIAPAVYDLFDNIIILRDGHIIYSGPREDVGVFLTAMGYPPPADVDIPSHVVNVTTHPKVVLQTQIEIDRLNKENKTKNKNNNNSSNINNKKNLQLNTTFGVPIFKAAQPCVTLDEMCEFFYQSPHYMHITQTVDAIHALRPDTTTPPPRGNTQRPAAHVAEDATHPLAAQYQQHVTAAYQDKQLPPLSTPQTAKYYHLGYMTGAFQLLLAVLLMQFRLQLRDKMFIVYRLIPCCMLAFLFGGLYFQTPAEDYVSLIASLCDLGVEMAFHNLNEISASILNRQALHGHLSLYPTWAYTSARQIASIPLALVETGIFTVIPYLMIDYAGEARCVIVYYICFLLASLVFTSIFRTVGSATTNIGLAYSIVLPLISLTSLCAGFYISPARMQPYVVWIHYISPFAFALKSVAANEMSSARHDHLIPSTSDPAVLVRAGDVYLKASDLPVSFNWVYWHIIYSVGMLVLLVCVTSYFLYSPYNEYSVGTKRFKSQYDDLVLDFAALEQQANIHGGDDDDDNDDDESQEEQKQGGGGDDDGPMSPISPNDDDLRILRKQNAIQEQHDRIHQQHQNEARSGNSIVSSVGGSTTAHGAQREPSVSRYAAGNHQLATLTNELPFTPMTLSFSNIVFTVDAIDEATKQPYKRRLLQGVSGYAAPSNSVCLMGSSGAGKTTLLNTLFGLNKTTSTQTVTGEFFLNGVKTSPQEFAHVTAYVEQFDTLDPFSTVYETLSFSAKMKLIDVADDVIHKVVMEVLEVLELLNVKDSLIGSPYNPILSPAQRKCVSIGVCLVANPSLLFLDEPTTGLSATAALSVAKTISRISRSGRACITTIHQPSAEIFYSFDSLLLLGSGGYPLYVGRMGRRARSLVAYFQNVEGIEKLKPNSNPSEWMIEQGSQPLPTTLVDRISQEYQQFYSTEQPFSQPPRSLRLDAPATTNTGDATFAPFATLAPKQQMVQHLHIAYIKSRTYYKLKQFLMAINPTLEFPGVEKVVVKKRGTQISPSSQQQQQQQHLTSETSLTQHQSPTTSRATQEEIKTIQINSDQHQQQALLQPQQQHQTLPVGKQFLALLSRTWGLYTRDATLFYSRFFNIFILNCFYTLFYLDHKLTTFPSVLTFFSASCIVPANQTYLFCVTALPTFNSLRTLFYKEQASKYYKGILWPLPFLVCEMVFLIPINLFCTVTLYWAIHSSPNFIHVLQTWVGYWVISFYWVCFSLMLSLICPTTSLSEIIQNTYCAFCFVFFGIAMPLPKINVVYAILMRIFPFYYLMRMLMIPQFTDRGDDMISVYVDDQPLLVNLKDYVSEYFDFKYHEYGWSILWLSCITFTALALAFFGAAVLRYNK